MQVWKLWFQRQNDDSLGLQVVLFKLGRKKKLKTIYKLTVSSMLNLIDRSSNNSKEIDHIFSYKCNWFNLSKIKN